MQHFRSLLRSLATACAITSLMALPQAAYAQVSFEGKTIDIMVNYEAGGATDSAARMIAPYIAKHLPGNPNVIVTNKTGAGGTAAVDYLIDSVAPDGMHIGYFSGTPIRWAMALDQVPAGTGDLPYVAGRSVNQILQTRTDSGLTYETFPGWEGPLFLAINSPDNHIAIRMRMLTNVLDVDNFEVVTGYAGAGKMVAAVRSNEVDIAQTNDSYYGPNREALLGDGVLTTFGQMGEYKDGRIVAQEGLEDIPVLDDLWRTLAPDTLESAEYKAWEAMHIGMAVQNVFVLPPNTPEEFIPVWSEAILKAYEDPDYVSQQAEIDAPTATSVDAEGVHRYMTRMRELFSDPDVKAAIESAINENIE